MTIHEGNKLNLKCKSRLKRANCSTLNGSSSIVSFDIVLSGDIEKKNRTWFILEMYRMQQNYRQIIKHLYVRHVKT